MDDTLPLRRDKLFLPHLEPLREAVVVCFREILGHAILVASEAGENPEEAVHRYRKSVRRGRALIRLLKPILEEDAYRGLLGELKAAFAGTSELRDADVVVHTLRRLVGDDPGYDGLAEALMARREEHDNGASEPTVRAEALLTKNAALLAALPDRLAEALGKSLDTAALCNCLARSYEKARKARKAAPGNIEALHEWRKRVKELRFQFEMLLPHASAGLRPTERSLSKLASALGEATDLDNLATALRDLPEPNPLAEDLKATLAYQIQVQTIEASIASNVLFDVKKKAFEQGTFRALGNSL